LFNRLRKNSHRGNILKGHGFSRAATAVKSTWASQAAEKLLLQHCFERAQLQSFRNCRKINAGFTGCGKTLAEPE
jgi:hypothetical protein